MKLFSLIFVVCIFLSGLLTQAYGAQTLLLSPREKAGLALLLKLTKDRKQLGVRQSAEISSEIMQAFDQHAQYIEVRNFNEFIELQIAKETFVNYELDSLSYKQLIDLIKPTIYFSKNQRIQRQIDAYHAERKQFFLELYAKGSKTIISQALGIIKSEKFEINEDLFNKVGHESKAYLEHLMKGITGEMLSQSNSTEVKTLVRLIESYFKKLPLKIKLEILYNISQMPVNTTKPVDLFLVFLQNSGPQLQKLLQVIGRSPEIPKEFQLLFQKLESQVKPVPWVKMKPYLENANLLDLSRFSYFEEKPLGVGTMAQAHRAQIISKQGVKHSYVVRVLKPDIKDMVEMDYEILLEIGKEIDTDPEFKKYNLPSMEKIIHDINKSVVEELDVATTVKNQQRGEKIYNREVKVNYDRQNDFVDVHVPSSQQLGQNVMLQELVFGRKPVKEAESYSHFYSGVYAATAEAIVSTWIEEAFFKSGFFHADLHQGNIMMKITDHGVRVNILDFGMVGELNETLRKSVLALVVGTRINRSDIISESFISMAKDMPEEMKEAFQEKIKAHVQSLNGNTLTLDQWTGWAIEQGLDLNYEFLKLNRGIVAVTSLLTDSKSSMSFDALAESVAMKNKFYLFKALSQDPRLKAKDFFALLKGTSNVKQTQCKLLFE